MIYDFVAIDFETAEPGQGKPPCSLGICVTHHGEYNSKHFLINPEARISPHCTRVHGITNEMVKDAPTFPKVWEEVKDVLTALPIVAHNVSFDANVLVSALERYGIEIPEFQFYDTALLSRLISPARYNLVSMCECYGIKVENHHNAESDSVMAAHLFVSLQLTAADQLMEWSIPETQEAEDEEDYGVFSGTTVEQKPNYVEADVEYDVIEDIDIEGKTIVITGQDDRVSREALYIAIERLGGKNRKSLSPRTDYLFVGKEDLNLVHDKEKAKSHKIVAAEQLRADGNKVKILPLSLLVNTIRRINHAE